VSDDICESHHLGIAGAAGTGVPGRFSATSPVGLPEVVSPLCWVRSDKCRVHRGFA
jgi:hypothetical protein